MTGNGIRCGTGSDRSLTVEDVAAAWIAVGWAECDTCILDQNDIRRVRQQATALFELFDISPRAVTKAAERSRCPAAAPHLAALAGEFQRFGDVFLTYSTQDSWEATSRRYLPEIRQAERALTALYLDWLTDILRDLFPEAAERAVPAAEVSARTDGGSLYLDIVKRCKSDIGDCGSGEEQSRQ